MSPNARPFNTTRTHAAARQCNTTDAILFYVNNRHDDVHVELNFRVT